MMMLGMGMLPAPSKRGLLGLDPGVTTGLVVLVVLGLGALGVSRVMKRRK